MLYVLESFSVSNQHICCFHEQVSVKSMLQIENIFASILHLCSEYSFLHFSTSVYFFYWAELPCRDRRTHELGWIYQNQPSSPRPTLSKSFWMVCHIFVSSLHWSSLVHKLPYQHVFWFKCDIWLMVSNLFETVNSMSQVYSCYIIWSDSCIMHMMCFRKENGWWKAFISISKLFF